MKVHGLYDSMNCGEPSFPLFVSIPSAEFTSHNFMLIAIVSVLFLQLTLSQQLNLITLEIFLQQETKVAEWLYFKGNQRSVPFKTMKVGY